MTLPKINFSFLKKNSPDSRTVLNTLITAAVVVRVGLLVSGILRTLKMASMGHKLINAFLSANNKTAN